MKIPSQAQKVFSGVIFDVYHWPEQMYDGSTATFEGLKRPDTTEIIAVQNGKIMICEQEQPAKPLAFALFGGRSEDGEEPLTAAKRELLEESGLESEDWELYANYEFQGKIEWNNYFYIARNCRKVAEQQLDAGEKIEVLSLDFDEFIDYVCHKNFWIHKDFVLDIYRRKLDGTLDELRQRIGAK